jgi:hypothetical protein
MISFTAHENDGEWVIRVQHPNGFVSLGAANGREEADLIVASLNLVCSDWASSAAHIKQLWQEYVSAVPCTVAAGEDFVSGTAENVSG